MKAAEKSSVSVPNDVIGQLKSMTRNSDRERVMGPQTPGPTPTPQNSRTQE